MKTYQVYFSQVNQTRYEVRAQDKQQAIDKAKRLWQQEFSIPLLISIDEVAE